jgi:hypothetical protein
MTEEEMRVSPLMVEDMREGSGVTHEWFLQKLSGDCHPDEKRIRAEYHGSSTSGTIEGFCGQCGKLLGVFAVARRKVKP